MIRRARTAPVGLTAAVVVLLLAVAATAQALSVEVTTVQASLEGPSDAQLLPFRPRLRRLVGYRAFRVIREESRPCVWRNREAFVIPGGRLLHVLPKGMREEAVVMQVQLLEGPRSLVDTDVRLQNRGVMLFGVDPERGTANGVIIIMLKAEE
ncbi:MAG TPA: hypothetical protein VLI07_09265 [Candidatus Binatus sp.]|nr:hypothetical protein [Candidatus Binatus sp.]